jgi:cytochrome c
MRRTTFAVLALAAATLGCLLATSAASAQAPAATIDAQVTSWNPPNVTINTGETVQWTFAGETLPHNVSSTSPNWNFQTPIDTGQAPVEFTFTAPGVYTFLCQVHAGTMTGSVTVQDAPADTLENVLVFSKTAGFRHSSIDEGIAAMELLGTQNDFNVDATEDSAQFTDANLAQYDAVIWLSTTGDVLTDDQQGAFERYIQGGGGYVGIHSASDTEYTWPWYGEMVGGYFRNHPGAQFPQFQQATVDIEDANEPSTTPLPAEWVRTDEWYNFQTPFNPNVGGGGTDYSPRDTGVHVLATLDESTYNEEDGSDGTNDDHPISWCSDFDGGTAWYTGAGHTEASFTEANFLAHVLGGIQTAARSEEADCGEARQSTPSAADFEKVTLDDDTENPFELDIAQDGRVFYIERNGEVNIWKPDTEQTVTAGNIPVYTGEENGLMGLQLAPDFEESGYIYLTYSALPESTNEQRVSRFTVEGDQLVPGSERIILTWQHQRDECCHSSGALDFGPDGSLYVSAGDNTNPFASDGFTPIDERPGRQPWDAQRTSANTNDLNGKFMRIMPIADIAPGTQPGVGTTYTIPAGNLYPTGTADTRPEIFAMGFRNPFRFTVDSETGWVLMGDYGPDAGATVPGRGPQGSVEFNAITSAGNYGWPYCVRQNVPYNDYDFATMTSGPLFNCAAPVNNSPNNTGLTNLPPARPATMWMGYTEMDTRFPGLGTGGAPTGGPRYHYDPDNPAVTKFPEYYDDEWFIGEWNNGWIKHATLDGDGDATDVRTFPYLGAAGCQQNTGPNGCYKRPMDMDFGPDGSLYLIEWGSGFGGNNDNSGIYRIDYVGAGRRPIASASADPTSGQPPLEVEFSSEGSIDPDGTSLTYEWNFGDGSAPSTDPNPTHTYTTAGTYTATLRVTDQSGATGVDNVQIVVGNTAPVVTITIPENGQFAEFGDEVPYEITVTDAEDGTTADGSISCADVTLNVTLGHDEHAHEISEHQGCEGTFETLNAGGHGESANTFTVIEAVYTDEAQPGGAIALTGRDEAILPRKRHQAEFFDSTGRAPGAVGGGDPGVQTETTGDTEGGGLNIGFIENGDYVSYEPMNLKDITALRFRVASAGAGGTIEVRTGAPDGPLVATTPFITPTGGWQTYKTEELALTSVPAGTHELFFVFRHPTDQGGLMNLNWIQFVGKGAATTAAPEVTASAEPTTGTVPLAVQFDAEGTDPENGALTYQWDFGVAGTGDDTSTEEDPTYTYQQPGTYTARVTVTDPEGAEGTDTVQVQVNPSDQCPTGPVRSDEFEGDALDTNRWTVIRPDNTRPPTVSGGNLNFPIDNGSIYGAGTSARNIVVQPLPEGQVQVTAKITTDPLTENYHQAGLRVYADDNNWASVHMIFAGGSRDFEFIYENAGNPRNEAADKLGGIPANSPLTYWVRIVRSGPTLTAFYSFDGESFSPVGRTADISSWQNPQIGPVALSDAAPSYPVARFDWIRFNPDGTPGGGGEDFRDDFNGSTLGSGWEVVRQNQDLNVSGGTLNIPAQQGDLYGAAPDNAQNLTLRDIPDGPWTATAKMNFEGTQQYHQAGLLLYGNDDNFTKFGRIAHTAAGDEKFEFIYETNDTPRNEAPDSTPNIPAAFPDDFYVRITSDGTNITGSYSTDGSAWTPVGRPAPMPANARIGMFAFSNAAATAPVAAFDWFELDGPGGGGGGGSSFSDAFDGNSLDKTRWNAIVRDVPAEYTVEGGQLTITTSPGDIYTGDTNPPPNNFILQDAAHADADWVIETKLSGTINGGYGQGGLMAYQDGNNYVKFDPISDAGSTRINRIELRSEVGGVIQNPQPNVDVPVGTTDYWIRLTKSGNNYSGEYSFDGTNWTAIAQSVANPMASPDFGIFAFGPQPEGAGDTVSFDHFLLNGEQPGDPCVCPDAPGDEFDGGSLDKTRWNNIIREDASLYNVAGGTLNVTTVNGDIWQDGDPAPTRNFFLQTADHAGADWVIETRVDGGELSDGFEHAGLLAYADDDNYVKYDLISDAGNTIPNRIELRSEVGSDTQNPQPQLTPLPAGTEAVSLRLIKTGTMYSAEYSFDGETWTSLGPPVPNPMASPSFGLFAQGGSSGGATVNFEYFSVDGETGCPTEPENRPPVVEDPTASPTIGFGPLAVDFDVEATDPDTGDELTYSWDFGDGGTSTEEDPSHTYTAPGEYEAEVTVSDGEAEVTRTVDVQVLEPDEAGARFRTLVFSETAGFRHSSIDEGHAALELMGEQENFQVDHTEDSTVFRAGILANYDTVVFLSTTGDVLNAEQQTAFEDYIQGGGGYTGIHSASDTEYDWNWYGHLVGAYFISHPPGTADATIRVEDQEHPSTAGLPASYVRNDEWYNFRSPDFATVGNGDYTPRGAAGIQILANVDEATYDEQDGSPEADDHPMTWCQRYDGGLSWYTAMGHTEASFTEANFLHQVLGGLETTARVAASETCGAADDQSPTVEAFADPSTGAAPLRVRFSAAGLDPQGDRLTYRWEFSDGGSSLLQSPARTYRQPGTYTATVTVTDPDGNTGSDTVQVTVTPQGNQAPVAQAAADPSSGTAPLRVRFTAQATDDRPQNQLTFLWDFDDGGGNAFGRNAVHTYMEPGTYTATVTVTDAQGAFDTAEVQVTVGNPPGNVAPTVQAAADPRSGPAPLRVRFTSAASDPDGNAVSTVWSFGDGSQAGGRNAVHTYTQPGTYTATVTVRDPGGLTDSDSVQITVTGGGGAGAAAPPAAVQETTQPAAQALVTAPKARRVVVVVKRGLRLRVRCPEACRAWTVLRLSGKRLGKSKALRIGAGRSRTLVIRLDRNVRRNLAAAMRQAGVRRLKATAVTKIVTADGTRTVRAKVTLKL